MSLALHQNLKVHIKVHYLKGSCNEASVGLFSQVTSARMRGNRLKLCQGMFKIGIRENFFPERMVRQVFKKVADMTLKDSLVVMIVGLLLDLVVLKGLSQL